MGRQGRTALPEGLCKDPVQPSQKARKVGEPEAQGQGHTGAGFSTEQDGQVRSLVRLSGLDFSFFWSRVFIDVVERDAHII